MKRSHFRVYVFVSGGQSFLSVILHENVDQKGDSFVELLVRNIRLVQYYISDEYKPKLYQ